MVMILYILYSSRDVLLRAEPSVSVQERWIWMAATCKYGRTPIKPSLEQIRGAVGAVLSSVVHAFLFDPESDYTT